jgi:hypothetical protein
LKVLSQKAVTDYQAAYRKVHGKEISYDEAQRQGLLLLRLFQITFKPIPKGLDADVKFKKTT